MSIIVTGASGFIGEQLSNDLLKSGCSVIGIDKVPQRIHGDKYTHYQIDLTTKNLEELPTGEVKCVCHLAASIRVDESMKKPADYYHNNVWGTMNLLNWCQSKNIKNIIFASTAAVYTDVNIGRGFVEDDPTNLEDIYSVYGKTKLMNEQMLHDYACSYGIKGYIFRFFNVCGGSEKNHGTPIHLIPVIINNIINHNQIYINGTDYQTRDGTCLRDYIHLKDISNGFIKALQQGFDHSGFKTYNLGSGTGYTVKEIIDKIIDVYKETKDNADLDLVGCTVKTTSRRAGDIDILLADSTKAKKELDWIPLNDLDTMIKDSINDFVTLHH